jgi:hypothetical protein
MKTLDWDNTDFLINLIKEEFVRQHNKPKDQQREQDLVALRKLAILLGYRRTDINILRWKNEAKKVPRIVG